MNKKIKIIDLINLMANEEILPRKIKYDGDEYFLYNIPGLINYKRDDGWYLFHDYLDEYFAKYLNEEVEILEDNTEEIEELNISQYVSTVIEQDMADKINELVRAVNQMRKDIDK